MGQKMGNVFKRCGVSFPITLDAFQKDFGRKSGILLKKYFPEAAEEIRGITDTIGFDNELFTSWMMCMGCCMYNLQDVNCVEVRGCTAFSFVHNKNVYYGRDNDLPPFLRATSKSVLYQPDGGNSFILNTSSFINGEEGINRHGLVAAMTFVLPKMEEVIPGINSVFLVRYILEKCTCVSDGITALEQLPIASSYNILLADKYGEMIVAECNPFETHIRYPEKNNAGESFIVTVNHFTSDTMRGHDASDQNVFQSNIRYHTASDALKISDYTDGISHAENILSGRHGFMCQYNSSLDFDTIWGSVFDISRLKVFRAEGNPQSAKFKEDTRTRLLQ